MKRRDKLPVGWARRLETEVKVITQRNRKEKKQSTRQPLSDYDKETEMSSRLEEKLRGRREYGQT